MSTNDLLIAIIILLIIITFCEVIKTIVELREFSSSYIKKTDIKTVKTLDSIDGIEVIDLREYK